MRQIADPTDPVRHNFALSVPSLNVEKGDNRRPCGSAAGNHDASLPASVRNKVSMLMDQLELWHIDDDRMTPYSGDKLRSCMKDALKLDYIVLLLSSSLLLLGPALAETNPDKDMYGHYLSLQQLQVDLLQRSPEQQQRLQPQVRNAERQACARLRQEQSEGMPSGAYRRQGGDQFVAFVEQFDQYCKTLHEQ